MGLRLPLGEVTVILGPSDARRRLMQALDEHAARCTDDHETAAVRLTADADADQAERLEALERVADSEAVLVLVDRLTDGLDSTGRQHVLQAARRLVRPERAVLVEDVDPVAALAHADGVLRTDDEGSIEPEPVDGLDDQAS